MRNVILAFLLVASPTAAAFADDPQSVNEIVVDVKAKTVTPKNPTIHSVDGEFVVVRIQYGDEPLSENRAMLRFAQPVLTRTDATRTVNGHSVTGTFFLSRQKEEHEFTLPGNRTFA